MNRLAIAAAAVGGFVVAGTAQADALITSFDNFNFNEIYETWAFPAATHTSGASGYTVNAFGFGGGFYDINPNLVAPGETHLEVDVTVNSGQAGIVLVLVDEDGTLYRYAEYGLPVGSYTISKDLSLPTGIGSVGTEAGLNTGDLSFLHVQIDPGAYTDFYDVTFEEIRLVPEPASLALLAAGGLLALRRRR